MELTTNFIKNGLTKEDDQMKKFFVVIMILLLWIIPSMLFNYSNCNAKVFHYPENNLIIIADPITPERKTKKPPTDEEPKDNDHFELLGIYIPDLIEFRVNDLVTGKYLGAIIYSMLNWNIERDLFIWGGYTEKYWYSNDGENTISFVKFTPRNYIGFAAIHYDPNITCPITGLDAITDVDIVLNALHRWEVDPDGEGPIRIKAFDVENIATHEMGHALGLADLYNIVNSELTMYGYASKGETKKMSLESGDIAGVEYIYGK